MRHQLVIAALALAAALTATPARAEIAAHVKVAPGDTLGAIARRYDCSVEAVQQQNRLRSTRIQSGQTLAVPVCGRKARAARPAATPTVRVARATEVAPVTGQSVGKPWRGSLKRPARLAAGKGYLIRRPERSYGTRRLVDLVRDSVKAVRADHGKLHTLAIGDLSARRGGKITEHHSHQSGRDVDVGFFFKRVPAGYPAQFVAGTKANLDLPATWDLLVSFARTADDRGGVSAIFLDYELQGVLYEWAKGRGVSASYLDRLFQYPDGKGGTGLVRHERYHDDHFHVRIQCPPGDAGCE
ncbi:MAG: penicillin-insensitive murein endopeptidase [Myxococcales bacterium]|nr:penicillin-insensitive murein endopeptidase [Myxococcales bacterium]